MLDVVTRVRLRAWHSHTALGLRQLLPVVAGVVTLDVLVTRHLHTLLTCRDKEARMSRPGEDHQVRGRISVQNLRPDLSTTSKH
jgi:hypothetical protein